MDFEMSERAAALREAGDGPVYAGRLSGGWNEIGSRGDPGAGFYRWDLSEIPASPRASLHNPMAGHVDLFSADLAGARMVLGLFIGWRPDKSAGWTDNQKAVLNNLWPVAHRPTRLCRRARAARGEL